MPDTDQFNIAKNVAWKLIASSPDMMDTKYCNKKFPFAWRSSLAIFSYEPDKSELPEELSDRSISYLKVACSITGYQPSKEETAKGYKEFKNIPKEELTRILSEYFACYGALVNVAVFPDPRTKPEVISPSTYPYIIDFEPKERELIQSASEKGELLMASQSKVKTDKTFSHTSTTKTGLGLNAKYKVGGAEIGGNLSKSWEDTDKESRNVTADASRERKETEGTTTTISQMYNILNGYHLGTNRAVFLMLPRPHTLQPTNRRTFAQGLRVIEGIQEFFIVVSRPKNMNRYCIEVALETGHFPEDVQIKDPEIRYKESQEDFWVKKTAEYGVWGSDPINIDTTHTIANGWEIDRTKGDIGHSGIKEMQNDSNGQANDSLQSYNYKAISDATAEVVGKISGHSNWIFGGDDAKFERLYRVFIRKQLQQNSESLPEVITPFFITKRGLCVCMGNIVEHLDPKISAIPDGIVDHRHLKVPMSQVSTIGSSEIQKPSSVDLLREIQYAMVNSWRLPSRQASGEIGFLESDYFKERIQAILSKESLETPVAKLGLLKDEIVNKLGAKCTVDEVLKMDISEFASKTNLDVSEAINERSKLLIRKWN